MGYEVISAKMLILRVSVFAIKNLGALNLSFRRVCVCGPETAEHFMLISKWLW